MKVDEYVKIILRYAAEKNVTLNSFEQTEVRHTYSTTKSVDEIISALKNIKRLRLGLEEENWKQMKEELEKIPRY